MNQIEIILEKIKEMLLSIGFVEEIVSYGYGNDDEVNYVYGTLYCIPRYITFLNLGFLIEYANSFEEAKKNLYEDGDSFPLHLGEEKILSGIKNEVLRELDSQRI